MNAVGLVLAASCVADVACAGAWAESRIVVITQPLSSSAKINPRTTATCPRDATFAFRLKDRIFATSPSRNSILELSGHHEVYTLQRSSTIGQKAGRIPSKQLTGQDEGPLSRPRVFGLYCAFTNSTQTGLGTAMGSPVGVSLPVSWSTLNGTTVSEP
jgi:hypothetical protein